jgi:DNA replication protein
MTEKVIKILKSGSLSVPKLLLTNYKNMKITEKELIMIIYLLNDDDFDPAKIANDLQITSNEALKIIDSLSSKDLVSLSSRTENGIREEFFCLDELYNKLALLIINEKECKEESTIYDDFEREFGRTLSPMEYEIIGAWLDAGIKEDMIKDALKEATYNGVKNLRYIDKIIFEWQKNGKQERKKEEPKKEVLFEYDWLNEEN